MSPAGEPDGRALGYKGHFTLLPVLRSAFAAFSDHSEHSWRLRQHATWLLFAQRSWHPCAWRERSSRRMVRSSVATTDHSASTSMRCFNLLVEQVGVGGEVGVPERPSAAAPEGAGEILDRLQGAIQDPSVGNFGCD